MVKDAFGFSRNVGVEAHESVDEVESGVHGLQRQYSRDDGDTISFAKEVEEDESPVMDIEASAVNNEDDNMITEENQSQPRCFSTESVLVPIPTPIPTPSLSTHPPPAPTPPFTSNPTPRPPIPTPSVSIDPPPTSTPPFTSNPTPRSPIPTPSLSTNPPPAPTPPFTSNPTPRPPIPTPSLSTDPPSAPTPPLTSDPNTRQVPPYVAKRCNRYWIVDIEDSHGVKREGRLKTNGVWTLPAGQRIIVPFNRQGQPIGEAAGLLMPSNYKDTAFSNIKAKFSLDNEIAKCFVLKKLGNNWRNYRGWLFHTFYEVEMSTEHNLDNHPDFIPYDMWTGFVDYRLNPRTQEMESRGPVSRGAIFVANHKKRDGSFVNNEAKNVCVELNEMQNSSLNATWRPFRYMDMIPLG
ncbi:mucin-1 isoform X1 [Senna tora]|uniref:Mucin-1 isoform X1 n=1 Tax=Senna tora TaxID=362788 RepID=A0A835CHR5_9FABA|nr:mucin-1 isoform X1 [Senna tora]